jgi:hypothetical protein
VESVRRGVSESVFGRVQAAVANCLNSSRSVREVGLVRSPQAQKYPK